jgi:hypothetical protein
MAADNAPQGAPSAPPGQPPRKKRGGSNRRQRTRQYVVRCTADEYDAIAVGANAAGLRGAAYLRAQALKGDAGPRAQHIPPVENQNLSALRGDLGRLNNNVNQIAKKLNSGEFYTLRELRQVLLDYPALRDAIFRTLGREPSPQTEEWDEFVALAKHALAANPVPASVPIPTPLLLRLLAGPSAAAAASRPKGRK